MLALALACVLLAPPPATVERDAFGVPLIQAPTASDCYYGFGQAVAEDRLWQMEMSRRIARGRLAEVMGPSGLASDRDILSKAYTDRELKAQFDALPDAVREGFSRYADGVNAVIARRKADGTLPPGYREMGFQPEPWTPLDSCAIAVMLARRFGSGGAGELRNLGAYLYLRSQPCKARVLDVIDDFAWQNDPDSVPTVPLGADPLRNAHPRFPTFTRKDTERQLAATPKPGIFEIATAMRLAMDGPALRVAQRFGAPFKAGSYAVVVPPARSSTGYPWLLSGPQMGHSTPSVVHEVSLDAPGLKVAGIDVPGIPAVVVGATPKMAWGLTSGVIDVEDVYAAPLVGEDRYRYGAATEKLDSIRFTVKVKGASAVEVVQERTRFGPVLLRSRSANAVFALRSGFWGREVESFGACWGLYGAKGAGDVARVAGRIPITFNILFAAMNGDTGWYLTGAAPLRAAGVDPRFPALAGPATAWKGFLPKSQMPHWVNPGYSVIANWNNKPAAWWPNGDSPSWGRFFRNVELRRAIPDGKLGRRDLEMVAWTIARRDTNTCGAFLSYFRRALKGANLNPVEADAARVLNAWDGWNVQGAPAALLYARAFSALRVELFQPHTGSLLSRDLFDAAIQVPAVWRALHGLTAYDYLGKRTANEVLRTAFKNAVAEIQRRSGSDPGSWPYEPGSIAVPGEPSIPYIGRGTYIQVVEMRPQPVGRCVASPGVAEAGAHSRDQVPLARAWTYKPMAIPR